jgi:lysozyme
MQPVIIDLSHYNGVVDFNKVKADGIEAVILKATQGTSMTDSKLASNALAARAAGLLIGAYHYGVAGDPEAQAEYFLSAIAQIDTVDTFLAVLDFERGTSNMSLADAKTFLDTVQGKMGVVPTLYTGEYLKSFGKQSTLLGYPLWLSEYGPQAKLPAGFDTWTFWQFTNGVVGPLPHTINGVTGIVDISYFNGTVDELKAFWAAHSS